MAAEAAAGTAAGAAELELELIQSHMAQKPALRGEVGCACAAGAAAGAAVGARWLEKAICTTIAAGSTSNSGRG